MNEPMTLSVVLPVRNQQNSVAAHIEQLLEELSELSTQIQVVAVDDASTDATLEILEDATRRFPQLHLVRIPKSLGAKAAAQQGLNKVTGDFIVMHESYGAIDFDGLRQLWELRSDKELVMAKVRTFHNEMDAELLDQLTRFASELTKHSGTASADHASGKEESESFSKRTATGHLQMLRRDSMSMASAKPNLSNFDIQRRETSRIISKI
jgi:glycosyltransferase involved in cell wall biosynthesis